jgi:flagellin-like protein
MNCHTWRRQRRRGVSDILATILLVAIVVVLVAVLFVLDSALTHGPGTTPIGSAFAVGGASRSTTCTGVGVPTVGCLAANDHVYTLLLAQSTVTFGSVLFEVKTPTGVPYVATTSGGFNILSIVGSTVAAYNLTASGPLVVPNAGSWVYFPGTGVSAGTLLTTSSTIVVDMGSVDPSGQGYLFLVAGTGLYSGTTTAVTLP